MVTQQDAETVFCMLGLSNQPGNQVPRANGPPGVTWDQLFLPPEPSRPGASLPPNPGWSPPVLPSPERARRRDRWEIKGWGLKREGVFLLPLNAGGLLETLAFLTFRWSTCPWLCWSGEVCGHVTSLCFSYCDLSKIEESTGYGGVCICPAFSPLSPSPCPPAEQKGDTDPSVKCSPLTSWVALETCSSYWYFFNVG